MSSDNDLPISVVKMPQQIILKKSGTTSDVEPEIVFSSLLVRLKINSMFCEDLRSVRLIELSRGAHKCRVIYGLAQPIGNWSYGL